MLVPKTKVCTTKNENGDVLCSNKYFVFDTETNKFVENRTFTYYDTMYECQEAIDYYNSFQIIAV